MTTGNTTTGNVGIATDGLGDTFPGYTQQPCPSCGHCPTCGRGGHQAHPWTIPMPYYPTYPNPYTPYWGPTWISSGTTITCKSV